MTRKPRTKKVKVICEICKKEFYRNTASIMNHIFCSKKCFGEYKSISQIGIPKSDDIKRAISQTLTGKLVGEKNPNYRGGQHGPLFGTHIPEERKKKISESNKGKVVSEETRRKMGDKKRGKKQTQEHIMKRVAKNTGKKRTENLKQHMREISKGENNANWKGGLSFQPYCPKFNKELKIYIRNKYNNLCFLCRKSGGKRNLSIHHVDYNKNTLCNGRNWGLIPLCGKCHSKTNYNRWYWFNLLSNYWVYKYMEISHEDIIVQL